MDRSAAVELREERSGYLRSANGWLVASAVASVIAAAVAWTHKSDASSAGIVWWWVTSMMLLVLGAAWPLPWLHRRDTIDLVARIRDWQTWLPWVALTGFALSLRVLRLDQAPTVMDGDEAALILRAWRVRDGLSYDPFGAEYYSMPNLYVYLSHGLARLAGGEIHDHRLISAVVGTLAVLLTWRLGRRLFGPVPGVLAGVILASLPLHLQMSRILLHNVVDSMALPGALLTLLVAIAPGRQRFGIWCGCFLAAGLFGYFGGRVFPVIITIMIVCLILVRQLPVTRAFAVLGWTGLGFLVVAAPLLVSFITTPGLFSTHLAHVNGITPADFLSDPATALQIFLPVFGKCLTFPLQAVEGGWFRHEAPSMGWGISLLTVAGAGTVLWRAFRQRSFAAAIFLFVPWVILTAGIALTVVVMGQRFLALTPLLAILAGVGLWQASTLIGGIAPNRVRASPVMLSAAAATLLSVMNLWWFAFDNRPLESYVDGPRTHAVWDLGWRLGHSGPAPSHGFPVVFAGAPFLWSYSFATLKVMAGNHAFTDLETAIAKPADVPDFEPGTLFVLMGDRASERCALEQRYPDTTAVVVRAWNGQLLYYAFWRGQLTGFSRETTPASSTLMPVDDDACKPGALN